MFWMFIPTKLLIGLRYTPSLKTKSAFSKKESGFLYYLNLYHYTTFDVTSSIVTSNMVLVKLH